MPKHGYDWADWSGEAGRPSCLCGWVGEEVETELIGFMAYVKHQEEEEDDV